jgi:hypothetical protein
MPARTAEDCILGKFVRWPHLGRMVGDRSVAIKARIPAFTAIELDRDDIDRRMPMTAPSRFIDLDPKDI